MVQLSFRWYGPSDPVRLEHIRQIPGVTDIVSALYDVRPDVPWDRAALRELRRTISDAGMRFSIVESIPVSDAIKLGLPERDQHLEVFCQNIRTVASEGIGLVVYNFMPLFDWIRTDVSYPLPDGSTTLLYDGSTVENFDPWSEGLPAYFPPTHDVGELRELCQGMSQEDLWANLTVFLETVVPVAESAGVRLAVHPDDPPWPVLGIPRVITDGDALARLTRIVDSPANGVTLCTGSLAANRALDLPAIIRRLAGRVHFAHMRNIRHLSDDRFYETAHPTGEGEIDMAALVRAYREIGFDGPIRPDHGRMIWGETGNPGYGLYDRALGVAYLRGLWEGIPGRHG